MHLQKTEGAGKTGCALHPRSRVQCAFKKTHTSIQVQREHSGLSLRSGFTAYFVLSPVRRALLPPSPRGYVHATWRQRRASGPHDFAVRAGPRSSVAALASTASHRTFV